MTTVSWIDLSDDERTALKRLNRGPYPALSFDLAQRLIAHGLAIQRENGIGISRDGRELVINTLLGQREQ